MLKSISPLDGRYYKDIQELSAFFSEEALIKYRIKVEVEYLISLSLENEIDRLPALSKKNQAELRKLYQDFSTKDAESVKEIEAVTNHDVKAVEYFIRERINKASFVELSQWIHFALTSEDVNNLAYSLMWQDALIRVYLPFLDRVINELKTLAKEYRDVSILALTHGQPATPTTLGKEIAVFIHRLIRQLEFLQEHKLLGKFGGATGTWSAHVISYPNVDWRAFSEKFINHLGLHPNLITTQIEPHDSIAESFHALVRTNSIFIDLCRDVWMYISRAILGQKKVEGEVGSSTMPHKINPIQFENAEGNLGLSNALLQHLATKLPVSRMQRDLSDSTVLRNQGTAMGYSLLAMKNIFKGLGRITINKEKIEQELKQHWEVLAEPIQTILRKAGQEDAYEQLKELTRGQKITRESIATFINDLTISHADKTILKKLSPETYTGLAAKLVE